jgi:hypothetical protein
MAIPSRTDTWIAPIGRSGFAAGWGERLPSRMGLEQVRAW